MHLLKILFVIMLCLPVAYLGYTLFQQLLSQLVRDSRGRTAQKKRTREGRDAKAKRQGRYL